MAESIAEVIAYAGFHQMDEIAIRTRRVAPAPTVYAVVQGFRRDVDVSGLRSWSGDTTWDYVEDECAEYVPADIEWNLSGAPAATETIALPMGVDDA